MTDLITPAHVDDAVTALHEQAPNGNVDGCRAGKVTQYPTASVEHLLRHADSVGWDQDPPPGLDGFHLTATTADTRYRFQITPPGGAR